MGRKPPWRVFLRAPEVPDQREIAEIEPVLVKNPKFCSKSGLGMVLQAAQGAKGIQDLRMTNKVLYGENTSDVSRRKHC